MNATKLMLLIALSLVLLYVIGLGALFLLQGPRIDYCATTALDMVDREGCGL